MASCVYTGGYGQYPHNEQIYITTMLRQFLIPSSNGMKLKRNIYGGKATLKELSADFAEIIYLSLPRVSVQNVSTEKKTQLYSYTLVMFFP